MNDVDKALVISFLLLAIIVILSISNLHSYSYPIGTYCLAQSGYVCQVPSLHSDNLTATVGQVTKTNWSDTYLLWVPNGQNPPNITSHFCPSAASNSVLYGISCFSVGNLSSGGTAAVKFMFNTSATIGMEYSGIIYASYYVGSSGPYNVQLAYATLRAV